MTTHSLTTHELRVLLVLMRGGNVLLVAPDWDRARLLIGLLVGVLRAAGADPVFREDRATLTTPLGGRMRVLAAMASPAAVQGAHYELAWMPVPLDPALESAVRAAAVELLEGA